MLRSLFLALALVTAPPVVPATTIPVDAVARAKFPNDKPEAIDALAAFNKEVNGSITYVSDEEHYGIIDHYVSMPADNKGDCEDYALTKMELLSAAGFPVVTNAKLVPVLVHYKSTGQDTVGGHMILAILLASGAVAYLDLSSEPMTRAELEARGYQFFDWRA